MAYDETITNGKIAEKFLCTYFSNDRTYKEFLLDLNDYYWNGSIDSKELFTNIRNDIENIYNKLIIHENDVAFNEKLKLSVECMVCEKLHDKLTSHIYLNYRVEDEHLFNKILLLDDKNVTVEQLGGSEEYVTRIHAAVVELSNLDAYKTPIEKLNCIITTIDMIYAQVKSELAEINEKDGKDNCIPVVENKDAFDILMVVIIKSKQKHLYSNIVFIDEFASILKQKEGETYRDLIDTLCTAIERIDTIEIEFLPSDGEGCKIEKELSYLKAIEFIREEEDDDVDDRVVVDEENEVKSFLNYHLRRLKHLIYTSVND